jgi:putative oxidoreductase
MRQHLNGETRTMATRPPSQHYVPGLAKLYDGLDAWAHVLIRVALGLILIPHGAQKLFGWFGGPGMNGFIGLLQKFGYAPGFSNFIAWPIALLEFFGGILLVIGLFTRPVALACLIFMLEAARFHYGIGGFFWTGRGNEYPLILAAMSLYLVIRGSGPYSVDAGMSKGI